MATEVGIRELLEAGVHFGHQTRRWNPKMRRFIYGERGGIHIIDLQKTAELLQRAQDFAANIASRGGTVMFVGTKKQARDSVKEAAERAGMPYIDQRWLGGLLTNFQTISKRIKRLHDLDQWVEDGTLDLLPTRERIAAMNEREKLTINLGGVRNLQRPPDAIFIIDMKTEEIGVREALRLKIPIIGLVDTNVDPDPATYPIPGNDDAIRSCKVIVEAIGDVVADRATQFRTEEEARRKEEEERQRREAEERQRREAEERQRREAEEAAAREAEQQRRAAEAEAQRAAAAEAAAATPEAADTPAQAQAEAAAEAPADSGEPAPATGDTATAPAAAAAGETEPVTSVEGSTPADTQGEAPQVDESPAAPPAPAETTPEKEPAAEPPPTPEEVQEHPAEATTAVDEAEPPKDETPAEQTDAEQAEAKAAVELEDHNKAKSPDQEVS